MTVDPPLRGRKPMLGQFDRSEVQGILIDLGLIKEVSHPEVQGIRVIPRIVTDKEAKDPQGPTL